jgi:hypothetical protein
MVNFDDIDDWAPKLAAALSPYVPDSVGLKLAATHQNTLKMRGICSLN